MGQQPGLEPHIEDYIDVIVEFIYSDPDLNDLPMTTLKKFARKLAYGMRPQIEICEQTENKFVFRVISPPVASAIGGCLGNDTNSHLHTGEDAITQSNAIFAICTDTVMRSYKEGSFTLANPLNFRTALPVGKPVLVTIEIGPRKRLTTGTIKVVLEENARPILREAIINMVRR